MFLTFFFYYNKNKKNGKYQHRIKPLLESKHLPLIYLSNAITYSPIHGGYNGSPELFFSVLPGDCSF